MERTEPYTQEQPIQIRSKANGLTRAIGGLIEQDDRWEHHKESVRQTNSGIVHIPARDPHVRHFQLSQYGFEGQRILNESLKNPQFWERYTPVLVVKGTDKFANNPPKVYSRVDGSNRFTENPLTPDQNPTGIPFAYDKTLAQPAAYDIDSTKGPFITMPEYVTDYPDTVTQALGQLYQEFAEQFKVLIETNREWSTDYRFIQNIGVQIDMSALTPEFLQKATTMGVDDVREILRGRIFEIENSMAMYQLLNRVFQPVPDGETAKFPAEMGQFEQQWRMSLQHIRDTTRKKIAIVGVTDAKYQSMKREEFGITDPDEELTDDHVYSRSGFDRVMSPEQLKAYMLECAKEGKESEFLFYTRSSDDVSVLKDPTKPNPQTILDDPETRRFIKEYTITPNIDAPGTPPEKMINDSKRYMEPMGMAVEIAKPQDFEDMYSDAVRREIVLRQLKNLAGNKSFFTPGFKQRLIDELGVGFREVFSDYSFTDSNTEQRASFYKMLQEIRVDTNHENDLNGILTTEGVVAISKIGIDLSKGIDNAFGLNLLHQAAQPLAKRATKLVERVITEVPADQLLSDNFSRYLNQRHINPIDVATGKVGVRMKPRDHSYGAYGHHTLQFNNMTGVTKFMSDLDGRGIYTLQPELMNPTININGLDFMRIERVFMTMVDGQVRFLTAFNSLMPLGTEEAGKNNVHGNSMTHWAPIYWSA